MKAILIGLGATALMDLWHLALRRGFGVASLDYCVLGRLLRQSRDCLVGWTAHYATGVSLALAFVAVAPVRWVEQPTLARALLFGASTVMLPLFILQPALGLGVAASKAPRPWLARARSLATHLVFGAGLYVVALLLDAACP